MSMRQLRLWHWLQVVELRASAQRHRNLEAIYLNNPYYSVGSELVKAAGYDRLANWHLGVVQMLNDHPECAGTTAEQDTL